MRFTDHAGVDPHPAHVAFKVIVAGVALTLAEVVTLLRHHRHPLVRRRLVTKSD
jgi:hypothetical protein